MNERFKNCFIKALTKIKLFDIVNTDNTVNTDWCLGMEKLSVYLQIVNVIKRKVDLELLKENEKLPSCRELAMQLGINPNTVQRAYSELEADGYIYTQPKKGVYVCAADKKKYFGQIAREKLIELKNSGISREAMLQLINEIYGE